MGYELNIAKQVKGKGLKNEKWFLGGALAALGGIFWGKLAGLPLIGKLAVVLSGTVLAAKVIVGVAASVAVGAIIAIIVNQLDSNQIREQQQRLAVVHFYLKHITDFMGI